MLGTDFDRAIAARLGRSLKGVQRRRWLLDIAPHGVTSHGSSSPAELVGKSRYERQLAGLTLQEIADQDGVPRSAVNDTIQLYKSRIATR